MKKPFLAAACAALALFVTLIVVTTASPVRLFGDGRWFDPPCDIRVAISEIEVLMRGVNPYSVWHGDVVIEGYKSRGGGGDGDKPVNVHPPWFYTAMLPLGLVPPRVASAGQFFLMLGCMAYLISFARRKAEKQGVDVDSAKVIGILSVLAIAVPLLQDFCSQNWMLILLAVAALMSACLNMRSRRGDVMAGLCWAVLMIKPQTGLIFAIPLLLRRRFTAFTTAVLACLAMSVPPALMCGTSPIDLILVTPGSNSAQFWGCGTFPSFLTELVPQNVAIVVGLLVGVVVCTVMTRLVSRYDDWFVFLMPAAVCTMYWTYARCYSHAMGWFFFVCIAIAVAKRPASNTLWILLAAALLTMTRLYNVIHLASLLPSSPLSDAKWIDETFPLVDTLHSALGLAITVTFCAVLRRNQH